MTLSGKLKAGVSVLGLGFIASVFLGAFYTVDQRERGVILRNGALIGVAEPGIRFKIPYMDNVKFLSLETKIVYLDRVNAYSRDQQAADLKVSVNYSLSKDPAKIAELYSRFGSLQNMEDRIILPRINQQVKTIFGQYNAERAINARGALNTDVLAA